MSCGSVKSSCTYDVHLEDFCHKWGHFAPHLCDKPCSKEYNPIHHFDKFTKAPLFKPTKSIKKYDFISCTRPKFRSAYNCYNPSSMINRVFYPNDVVCGNCPLPGEGRQKYFKFMGEDMNHCDVMEFPFEISQCPEIIPQPIKIKSGAERCLHPSSVRYLQTTNRADLQDFYKTKKRAEIQLYRSKYAIDNRQRGPRIPEVDDSQMIMDGSPITVNAKVAKWKGGNLRPTYDICFPECLTIEKFDFSIGSLDNLPPNCKPMAVIC